MYAYVYLGIVMGIPSVILSLLHIQIYETVNALALSMITFLVINTVICVWELALFYCFNVVDKVHTQRGKAGFYSDSDAGKQLRDKEPIIVFKDMPLSQLMDPRTWVYIWIDYARFDVAYTEKTSFGYNIDVGNGHSTLIPYVPRYPSPALRVLLCWEMIAIFSTSIS